MKKKLIIILLLISFSLSACASPAKNISAAYVSPLQYQHYSCSQVGQELGRIDRKIIEISGQQDRAAAKDAIGLTVGMVLFWPALFLMIGGDKKEELSRLKGEHEALESVAIEKKCETIIAEIEETKKRQEEIDKSQKEKDRDAEMGL